MLGSRCGLAAVEFALTAPLILLLMLAGTDLTIFMRTRLRIDGAATELAQTVTQYSDLYDGDFSGLFTAAQTVAGSTPVTGLLGTTIITGIVNSDAFRLQGPEAAPKAKVASTVTSEGK